MRRKLYIHSLRAFAIVAAVLSAACGGDDQEAGAVVDQTPAVVPTTSAAVRVSEVQLGRSIGADKRVTAPLTEFTPNDSVYASVVTDGSAPNATVSARWTYEDGQVVEETTQTITPSGTAVTEFHVSRPGGWPTGRYQVQISLNGTPAQTRDFQVR